METFIFGSIIFCIAVGWLWMRYKDSRDEWEPLADELGLEFKWRGPFSNGGVAGTYRGMQVSVRVAGRHHQRPVDKLNNTLGGPNTQLMRSDKRSSGTATYTITSDDIAADLAIAEQSMAKRLTRLLGIQDVEVGSKPLDDAFFFHASEPALAREVLRRDGVESALLELRYKTDRLSMAKGTLRLRFTKPHRAYEVSAYIAKLTGLMAMLATEAPRRKALPINEADSDLLEPTAEALPENWW